MKIIVRPNRLPKLTKFPRKAPVSRVSETDRVNSLLFSLHKQGRDVERDAVAFIGKLAILA